jgi:hypothetical protein
MISTLANTDERRRALRLDTPVCYLSSEYDERVGPRTLSTDKDFGEIHHQKTRPDHHDTGLGLPPSAAD